SFLTGFETAARMLSGGAALVFSSELASRALPWDSAPEIAGLFGDGAAAAVLRPASEGSKARIAASLMRTYPSAYTACGIGAGGTVARARAGGAAGLDGDGPPAGLPRAGDAASPGRPPAALPGPGCAASTADGRDARDPGFPVAAGSELF